MYSSGYAAKPKKSPDYKNVKTLPDGNKYGSCADIKSFQVASNCEVFRMIKGKKTLVEITDPNDATKVLWRRRNWKRVL